MRVCGGKAKGIKLQIPKNEKIRPATEANRERLFSSLGNRILDTSFLDLYAGSGSYGLEALSRGAKYGTFVENNRKTQFSLKSNIINVCKSAQIVIESASLFNRDVVEFLKNEKITFDIIFLDPPYHLFSNIGKTIFKTIKDNRLLNQSGLLVHEGTPEMEGEFDGWKLSKKIGKEKKGAPQFRFFQLEN